MNLKYGIAFSGSKIQTGTFEEKIKCAIDNRMPFIQLRASDVQDLIFPDGQMRVEGTQILQKLVAQYKQQGGHVSIHLPSPVWEGTKLSQKNNEVIKIIKDNAVPLGIDTFTIHPYFDRIKFVDLSIDERIKVLDQMSKYFAEIACLGVNLAIENIPVRDIQEILEMEDSEEKRKSIKNISYGMTIKEIKQILKLTKEEVKKKKKECVDNVGVTFDTGHALSKTEEDSSSEELDKWVHAFAEDIKIYHITPSLSNKEKTKERIEDVLYLSDKYDVKAYAYVESKADLNKQVELHTSLKESVEEYNKSKIEGQSL